MPQSAIHQARGAVTYSFVHAADNPSKEMPVATRENGLSNLGVVFYKNAERSQENKRFAHIPRSMAEDARPLLRQSVDFEWTMRHGVPVVTKLARPLATRANCEFA